MSEYDFDAELAALLKSESLGAKDSKEDQPKQASYHEKLDEERNVITKAFHDHILRVHTFNEDITLESMFDIPDEASNEELYGQLTELIQEDIKKIGTLQDGEVYVTGIGPFMISPGEDEDDERVPVEMLEGEDSITGTFDRFAVAPLVELDEETSDLEVKEIPELWICLKNAQVMNSSGFVQYEYEEVMIPFTKKDLSFYKVIRTDTAALVENKPVFPERNVKEQFTGELFRQVCNDVENDLNLNKYDMDEMHRHREEHVYELRMHTDDIEPDELFEITIENAKFLTTDETKSFKNRNAYYDQPAIVKIEGSWRVVHGFSIADDEGGELILVMVLPEDIKDIKPVHKYQSLQSHYAHV